MTDDRYAHAARLLAEGHTQSAVASAVGVSARQLRRWIADELLPEVATNGSSPNGHEADAVGGALDWSRAEAERRKQIALARKHELQVAELEGELVRRSTIAAELGPVLDRLRRGIMNIEGRWANHFPGCEPEDAAPVLRRMAHELLEELSNVG